jgi:hypothetical protein
VYLWKTLCGRSEQRCRSWSCEHSERIEQNNKAKRKRLRGRSC